MGFLQLSPEADQNYEAHKNNHVNNLLCRQDDGTVILPFRAAGNSPLFSHMPSSSMEIIAQRAEKHILNQKRKKRGAGKHFFFQGIFSMGSLRTILLHKLPDDTCSSTRLLCSTAAQIFQRVTSYTIENILCICICLLLKQSKEQGNRF